MSTPLVALYREQLSEMLGWYRHSLPRFRWGSVIHARNERGRDRFGVVTLGGESMALSGPLLEQLAKTPCWLDGATRVQLKGECCEAQDPLAAAFHRANRAPLVERLNVHFDTQVLGDDAHLFTAFAGEFEPASLPSEIFLLARKRPDGWPL